jgi:hypothetical protein
MAIRASPHYCPRTNLLEFSMGSNDGQMVLFTRVGTAWETRGKQLKPSKTTAPRKQNSAS